MAMLCGGGRLRPKCSVTFANVQYMLGKRPPHLSAFSFLDMFWVAFWIK